MYRKHRVYHRFQFYNTQSSVWINVCVFTITADTDLSLYGDAVRYLDILVESFSMSCQWSAYVCPKRLHKYPQPGGIIAYMINTYYVMYSRYDDTVKEELMTSCAIHCVIKRPMNKIIHHVYAYIRLCQHHRYANVLHWRALHDSNIVESVIFALNINAHGGLSFSWSSYINTT